MGKTVVIRVEPDLSNTAAIADEEGIEVYLILQNPEEDGEGMILHLSANSDPETLKAFLAQLQKEQHMTN